VGIRPSAIFLFGGLAVAVLIACTADFYKLQQQKAEASAIYRCRQANPLPPVPPAFRLTAPPDSEANCEPRSLPLTAARRPLKSIEEEILDASTAKLRAQRWIVTAYWLAGLAVIPWCWFWFLRRVAPRR
jgi:hypothetical protein